jgi:hypothetical protein
MDSVVTADFSLHQISVAAPPVSYAQAVVGGPFPQQQTPYLAEQKNGSSSHVSVVSLHIIRTLIPAIIYLSNTQQLISLKLTNNNWALEFDLNSG